MAEDVKIDIRPHANPSTQYFMIPAKSWKLVEPYYRAFIEREGVDATVTAGVDVEPGLLGVMVQAKVRTHFMKLAKFFKVEDKLQDTMPVQQLTSSKEKVQQLEPQDPPVLSQGDSSKNKTANIQRGGNSKYPWNLLVNRGDYFIVADKRISGISPLVNRENTLRANIDGVVLRCHSVAEGVIVIVIEGAE